MDLVRQAVGRDALRVEPTAKAPFHPGRAARLSLDGVDVGVVGELHPRVAAAFEVPPRTLVGEVALGHFVVGGILPRAAAVPSPLPGLTFDVAVLVDADVTAAEVETAVRTGGGRRLTALTLFDVYRGEQLGAGRKSLAFRVRLDDAEPQLTDADEAAAIEAIERAVAEAVGGTPAPLTSPVHASCGLRVALGIVVVLACAIERVTRPTLEVRGDHGAPVFRGLVLSRRRAQVVLHIFRIFGRHRALLMRRRGGFCLPATPEPQTLRG